MIRSVSEAIKVSALEHSLEPDFVVGEEAYVVHCAGSTPSSPLNSVDISRTSRDLSKAIRKHYSETGEYPIKCIITYEFNDSQIGIISTTFLRPTQNKRV